MSLCASVYMCFMVTCWERADLLALVCGVYSESTTFPLVSWVRCGTWLYRFLIFAPLLTFIVFLLPCDCQSPVSLHHCHMSWPVVYECGISWSFSLVFFSLWHLSMDGSRGGSGSLPPPPPLKLTNIGFLSNTGQDPLKNHKATKQAFNVGPSSARQRNAI